MDLRNYFGKALKTARIGACVSEQDLARDLGIRVEYLFCLEHGLVQPDLKEILDISAALDIEDDLLIRMVESQLYAATHG